MTTEPKSSDSLFLTTLMAWFRIAAGERDAVRIVNERPPPPPDVIDIAGDVDDEDDDSGGDKAAGLDIRENSKLDVLRPTKND